MRKCSVILALSVAALLACDDKAREPYAKCVTQEAGGNVIAAANECEKAVQADPNSTSGKAAATKLAAMQPALATAKEAKKIADAKEEEEARRKRMAAAAAEAEAKKEEMAALAKRIGCVRVDSEECISSGKGRVYRECTGSTYAENEKFALLKGCVHARYVSTSTPPDMTFNHYCCPD